MVAYPTSEIHLTSHYSDNAIAVIQDAIAHEKSLNLIDETCPSRFLLHPVPTKKVILFFHGFTAVPQQFLPIGEFFYNAGYNVIIPLLPGHGLAGNWGEKVPPPLPELSETYFRFARTWLNNARAFGERIVVGGLSSGSTLAAWLSLEEPGAIAQTLLFAPYLKNYYPWIDFAVKHLDIYFRWHTKPEVKMFGYAGFQMPALRLSLEIGQQVLNRIYTGPVPPLLVVSSESDRATNNLTIQHFFQAVLKHQPDSWYHCFKKQLAIPHNMMTEAEGNTHYHLVYAIAKAFVEGDFTRLRTLEVESAIAQNESING